MEMRPGPHAAAPSEHRGEEENITPHGQLPTRTAEAGDNLVIRLVYGDPVTSGIARANVHRQPARKYRTGLVGSLSECTKLGPCPIPLLSTQRSTSLLRTARSSPTPYRATVSFGSRQSVQPVNPILPSSPPPLAVHVTHSSVPEYGVCRVCTDLGIRSSRGYALETPIRKRELGWNADSNCS